MTAPPTKQAPTTTSAVSLADARVIGGGEESSCRTMPQMHRVCESWLLAHESRISKSRERPEAPTGRDPASHKLGNTIYRGGRTSHSPGHEGQAWVLAVARYRAVPGEATDNDARQGQDDPLWKTGNRSI